MIHGKVFAALQKELENKYVISSSIRHKGERGRSREYGVAGFLREHLPAAYGVVSGELFSFCAEGVSPQCDIIIYDRLRFPIFGSDGAVQQVPIEGSLAVIEVRSILDTKALKDTRKKFTEISQLWEASCRNDSGNDLDEGPRLYLFAFKKKASEDACRDFTYSTRTGECSVHALDSGCTVWVIPDEAQKSQYSTWLPTVAPEQNYYASLAFFYFEVFSSCSPYRAPLDYIKILLSIADS